ncbi:MAG: Uma2 family endonuclease [Isosphaeraceae bacterium]|nr:Uma2 family endonuclease [Isosphaeraceae bacterium]
MATVTRTETPSYAEQLKAHGETRVLLRNVPWEAYEVLRNEEANNHVHMTYLDGDLELITVSPPHERYPVWFGLFIIELARVFHFPIMSFRCTTWKKKGRGPRKGKGKEADDCFYIANRDKVRGKKMVDLKVDPPPDLAIEVEPSESALDIMKVYEALRVPEVWRFDAESFRVFVRQPDGAYKETRRSPALPFLQLDEVVHRLRRAAELDDDAQFCNEVHAWAREVLVPRRNA